MFYGICIIDDDDMMVNYIYSNFLEDVITYSEWWLNKHNFFNKIDAMHYSTYGCAIQATDDETLKKAIKGILDEKEVRDKLEIMSDNFTIYFRIAK